jgi:tRNA(Arg) A34 adenosine deaminase TadA
MSLGAAEEASDAFNAFNALDEPWRIALAEAWASWANGSAGVGAVVSDADGTILTTGRNRILEPRSEPGVLASTFLAHAEMNALAVLPVGPAAGRTITTTFEPCLMCASTIVQIHLPRVRYAAADPVFDGLHDWFSTFPFASSRLPEREELGGTVGAFAHVLHVSWLSVWNQEGEIIDAHRNLRPAHLDLAREIVRDQQLENVARDGGDVVDALRAIWPALTTLPMRR